MATHNYHTREYGVCGDYTCDTQQYIFTNVERPTEEISFIFFDYFSGRFLGWIFWYT